MSVTVWSAATWSWRTSVTVIPKEQKTPASSGTKTFSMPSSRASSAACRPPAPPAQTRVKPRGSTPRSTETARIAPTMLALTTRTIPAAASTVERPSGSPTNLSTAARERSSRSRRRPPRKASGFEVAEDDVGVGDGRLGAALVVTGGAGVGAGAARADPQGVAGVDPADRAAAGADRVDVDRGHADRLALDLDLAAHRGAAVFDQADVEAGAAHVDRDQVRRRPSRRSGAPPPGAAAGPEARMLTGRRRISGTRAQPPLICMISSGERRPPSSS